MALVKNDAKNLADEDLGLNVNTDSYLRSCINITSMSWKDAKSSVDGMNGDELDSFISAISNLELSKSGSMTFRLSIKDYAMLKLVAGKNGMTVTAVIETAVQKMKTGNE
ncbi:hypothetical protein KIV40_06710 [Vibrio sp. D173a]|uniref:hypothetical protein n=1 Tax=Vibrio sp. D173a TaxID=2836349 RepID=UPI002554AA0D|nr:hypothetical protein [Vibrio sp. D173a]MDK9755142.1 hypothetical protein [Vibrio sp. D173a]